MVSSSAALSACCIGRLSSASRLGHVMSVDESWQTRTWDELKAETQARADRGAYPVFAIKPDDARAALAMIDSLDPDEWGQAWMAIGDRYAEQAQHLAAWRLYTLGRWPVAVSDKKRESLAKARTAF